MSPSCSLPVRPARVRPNSHSSRGGTVDRGEQGAFRSTAVAVVAFGVAMGYLEAAVVVYLRSAIETGSVLPAHHPATFRTFESIKIARELATLVMIAAVGWLAERTKLSASLARPSSSTPGTSSTTSVCSWPSAGRRHSIPAQHPGLRHLAGGDLVIASFLVDTNRVLAGDVAAWSGWPFFWAGMALATAATASSLAGGSAATATLEPFPQHGPERGPSVGAPEPHPTGGRQHG